MRKIITIICVSMCLQAHMHASAENGAVIVNTDHYTVQAGLLTNEVNSIAQDDNGFIWFATNNGLSRFDGYEFKNFRSGYMNPGFFKSNTVASLVENGEEIWFVTPEGLEIFNQKTEVSEYVSDASLDDANLKDILLLPDGKALLGGTAGLFLFDRETGSVSRMDVPYPETARLTNVRRIYRDRYGNIWIGTWRKGLYFILNGMDEVHELNHPDLPDEFTVTSFAETHGGDLVLGTWDNGIMAIRNFSQGQMEVFRHAFSEGNSKSLEWNIIYDVAVDRDDNVWLGSPGGLRAMSLEEDGFHDKDIIYGKGSEITSFNEVMSVFCDRNGIVWVSDYGNGIVSICGLNKAVMEYDFKDNGLTFNTVTGVYEDSEGTWWLGIRGYGLVRYSPGSGRILTPDRLLESIDEESNSVVSFVEVPEKNVLFMAMRYYGVYMLKFDGDRNIVSISHFDTARDGVRNSFTNHAARDDDGNIWVATQHGVVVLADDGDGYMLHEPDWINRSVNYCSVSSVCQGAGRMWLSTYEYGIAGLDCACWRADASECAVYNLNNGRLNNNDIRCMYLDSEGTLWAGSKGGGLSFYDAVNDVFSPVGSMPLFQSDEILSIVEDAWSNLWLATGNGFICYSHTKDGGRVRNYGPGSGLGNLSFIQNAVWSDGERIMFGGYDGLSVFRPEDMLTDEVIPAPKITDIQLYNNSLSILDDSKRMKTVSMMPPFTDEIRLGYRDRSVSITFASPNYADNSLVRYSYRLDRLDKDWNYVTSNGRTVTYSNLKPGDYVFSVRAVNLSGQWTEPCTMRVRVSPAPWFTAWAMLGYLVVFIVLAYFVFNAMRNRMRLRQALEIEQMERLKSEEVNNAKLMFFTNVSHELFTPMTIMKVALEKLMETDKTNSRQHVLIRSNLNRLMRLLQQIMEFRKAESSNLKLKVSETDIVSFIKRICDENFSPYVSDRNISLVFSSDSDRLEGYVDKDKLDKILYNLLSNAYKYNRQDGSVFCSVSSGVNENGRAVTVSVRDTGFGIAPERQADLFKRFYEGDYRQFNTRGVGIGLSLTKELVSLHNGTIKVNSIVGEGTEFTVTLPIDKEAYREDQIDIGMEVTEGTDSRRILPEKADKDTQKHTLLLVEDNSELLFVMKDMFLSDYNVLTAANGSDALEILRSEDVDVVITDLVMPVMDGAELCRTIRSDLSLSHLPVIMLSARLSAESKMESFGVGVDAYVEKPFDPKLLMAQVEGLIAGRKRLSAAFREGPVVDTDLLTINTDIDRQFIDKVIHIIEEHISESEFNMAYLNSAMNMSSSTLYRKIKGLTGMSPKEFVRNIRFKYACKLLLEKSTNITDVAYMCGFTDAKYFSMIFKREFGMTPSKYISLNRVDKHVELS